MGGTQPVMGRLMLVLRGAKGMAYVNDKLWVVTIMDSGFSPPDGIQVVETDLSAQVEILPGNTAAVDTSAHDFKGITSDVVLQYLIPG